MSVDDQMKNDSFDSGCTSCVVLLTPDTIYCANAGDSRSVLCTGDSAVGLSEDHKPGNEKETERAVKAGHKVSGNRIEGNLAISRGFGDF